jgi:hypothetical protein
MPLSSRVYSVPRTGGLPIAAERLANGAGSSPTVLALWSPVVNPAPCKSAMVRWECESLCDGHCAALGECCAVVVTTAKKAGKCECRGACGPCDATPVKYL